ncbi:MAG TPA: deoxyribonuclease IV [Nitrolancea sp.]|nr:deoxyribonuclease IV [Nitrolancea sp.]
MRFGAHMSIAGGLEKSVDRAELAGCDSLQIFTKNGNQWKAKPIEPEQAERYEARLAETDITPVVAHDSYLINLASPDDEMWEKSIDAFRIELERCEQLSVPFLVTHPGSFMKSSEEEGFQRIAEALNRINGDLAGYKVMALLETTAGQGTNIGHRFEQLAAIMAQISAPERVGCCFDTCHVFAAGYEIRTDEGYAETMDSFDSVIGLDKLKVFHFNDSKKEFGSRRDRHEHIGEGEIGLDGFRHFVNDPRFADHAALLETPKSEDLHEDIENLDRLRGLVAK